jgi:tryptophanyl-tRNA synthetase
MLLPQLNEDEEDPALEPVREKRKELESDIEKVREIIEEGNRRARSIAVETMREVREAIKIE